MTRIKVHVYASAYELQGVSEWVDESDFEQRKEQITQTLFDNFVKWLKHPVEPEDFEVFKRKMELNGGIELVPDDAQTGIQYGEVTHKQSIEQAERRKSRGKAGAVTQLHGVVIYVTQKMQITFRSKKSGRFVSRQYFENA